MSDVRRRIEALRAKAASTTFPAEAASLRAKADELEDSLPPPAPPRAEPTVVFFGPMNTTTGTTGQVTVLRNITFGPGPGGFITVTNIFGQSHQERLW